MNRCRPIHVLSDQTIRKIAAGEVVERPHSIVKELLENAVDAMANSIEVSVIDGGMQLIQVKDDGIGFSSVDLPLATVKNATSKIETDQDLINIATNGFRGEALSSISAVSKFEIITQHQEEDQGFSLRSDGGTPPEIKPAPASPGTMITVKDVFFNVPARKKFLKSKTTEYNHIEKTFKKIALAHPGIQFVLKKDQKTVLNLAQVDSYKARIAQLYPEEVNQSLVAFETTQGPIEIFGFAANQQSNYSKPSQVWIFVNGRWVQDRARTKAIYEGYRSALMEHKFPVAFVYIQMPPSMFDINVHPTKSEIRFQDPQILFRMLQQSIAAQLKTTIANHRVVFQPKTSSYAPTRSELQKLRPSQTVQTTMPIAPIPFPAHVEESTQQDPIGYFSSLTYLSVLDGTYIICKGDTELVLIDQHAAHERILFEKLSTQWRADKSLTQKSLIPVTIALTSVQLEAIATISAQLEEIGFVFELFGDNDIILRSLPSFLPEAHAQDFLFDMLDQVERGELPTLAQDMIDHLLSTTACHSAIRAHDRMQVSEIQHLLRDMDQVDHASYCPHGRPSFVKMDLADLEKIFKRKV